MLTDQKTVDGRRHFNPKIASLVFIAVSLACGWHACAAATQSSVCPASGLTASANMVKLSGNCTINGNVNLSGTAQLVMMNGTLTINGNAALSGNAELAVSGGTLVFPQTNNSQYSITLNNGSQLAMQNSTLVTNGTQQNNFSMALQANGNSQVNIENSNLNTNSGSWLLGNFADNSQLNMVNAQNLPTEIYPTGSSRISISSASEFATVWLDFPAGSHGTIKIPTKNAQGQYNFSFGPAIGIATAINVSASSGRLGFNSHPNSTMIVNGNGASGTNDVGIVFGYYIANNTAPVSINGLTVGSNVTRQFTDQGRLLQLNHVNLNPFSWQVYVSQSNNHPVSIANSLINEIGVLTNGYANISNCVLQLAVAEAGGAGSKLNISNSQIWSQAVIATSGGQVDITNSQLYGNLISANGSGSSITLTNVGDNRNGTSPQTCAAVNGYPPNNNGVPLCNPYNPLYQCVQMMQPTGGANITASPYPSCPSM